MYCSINALIKHFKAKFEDSIWFRRQMFGRFTCNIYMGVDGLLKLMVANRQCGIYVMDREYLKNLCRSHCFLFSITPFLSPIFLFQITILKTMGNTWNVMESHFYSQFLTIFTVFCFVLFVFCHNLLHIRYMLHYGALTCKIRLTITSNTLSKKKRWI